MAYVFDPPEQPSVAIKGRGERFPVRRIFCVGRNYAEHAREMGGDAGREPPFFFTKPADAVVENGATIPYPSRTDNLHHEVELVLALGRGGRSVGREDALQLIYGYAVGVDLTRRDLQAEAKKHARPWDVAKGFDRSAPTAAITPAAEAGPLERGRIWLAVNGDTRQQGDIADMIWSPAEVLAELSTLVELRPGDLVFTGTPAGVGRIGPGDEIRCGVHGLEELSFRLGEAATAA
ncbi:MAG TPA: fumarylacetoacetate hydrolase family protein [Caulobacteraceae bacterium]|jgi:fumarylpyruvate hydrolase